MFASPYALAAAGAFVGQYGCAGAVHLHRHGHLPNKDKSQEGPATAHDLIWRHRLTVHTLA